MRFIVNNLKIINGRILMVRALICWGENWSNSKLLVFISVDHRRRILIDFDQTIFLLIRKLFSNTRKWFNSISEDRSSQTSNRRDYGASLGLSIVPPMIVIQSTFWQALIWPDLYISISCKIWYNKFISLNLLLSIYI